MKAAVLTAHYKMEFQDIPEPQPGPDEVKIKVVSAGICGSELHAFKGTHPFRHPPSILGHEVAGDIVAVGPEVQGFRVGDRVTVEPQIPCGACDPCRASQPNLCQNKTVLGTQKWIGAYAEYFVAPESVVYRIPDSMTYDQAVMIEPLAVGVHAVRLSGLQLGQSAVILGGGTIGLCALVAAREAGVLTTVVTDVEEFNLKSALAMGATAAVNVRLEDPQAAVERVTGGHRADAALVAVGLSPVVNQGLAAVKRTGTVVLIGLFAGELTIADPYTIVGGELRVIGSNMYTGVDMQIALDLIASGRVDAEPFITQRLPMSEVQHGFEIVDRKLEDCVKVVLHW